jgi:hypothetical protein
MIRAGDPHLVAVVLNLLAGTQPSVPAAAAGRGA